ncbi:MAG: ATP-dependent Clp protease proteolytic subunit, partial [Armatimonadetes bacterium]|nr:ATP-dependent Clp protease proteolytic subunit [Armatimonadota bacterium]
RPAGSVPATAKVTVAQAWRLTYNLHRRARLRGGSAMGTHSVRLAGCALIVILVMVLLGCQRGQPPAQPGTSGGGTQASAQDQALQELLKYAQETGQTLEQVRQDLERLAASQRERGASPVLTDLRVVSVLLTQAREALAAKDSAKSLALLARMGRVGRGLLAELPGQQAALRIERALTFLSADAPDAAAARAALASVADVLAQAKDTGLAPDIAKSLESARSLIDTKPEEARRWLEDALDKCANDKVATWAYQITLGLTSAYQAVQREAWLVAAAELDQVQALITKLQSAAAVTPAAPAPQGSAEGQPPSAAPAQGQQAAPATGQTPGTAPAAPSPGASSGTGGAPAAPGAGQQPATPSPQTPQSPATSQPPTTRGGT